jgi:hypothetical protein
MHAALPGLQFRSLLGDGQLCLEGEVVEAESSDVEGAFSNFFVLLGASEEGFEVFSDDGAADVAAALPGSVVVDVVVSGDWGKG